MRWKNYRIELISRFDIPGVIIIFGPRLHMKQIAGAYLDGSSL